MNHVDDDPHRSLYMGEFSPGMWIGNLQSIKYILDHPDVANNVGTTVGTTETTTSASTTAWTIISVLESDRLLDYVRDLIQQQQQQPVPRLVVRHHFTWKLPDTSQAHFLSGTLLQVLAYMDKSFQSNTTIPSKCLVHCAMGISRSAAICAAWLMHNNQCGVHSLPDAIAALQRVRPGVQPNMGLTASLLSIQAMRGNVPAAIERAARPQQCRDPDQEEIGQRTVA
jgi:protein-tyrosine phosphatase